MNEKKEIHESPPAVGYVTGQRSDESLRQRLLAVLQSEDQPRQMNYEEFLTWADEDTLAEWVEGEIVMTSPASKRHQDINDFLTVIFRAFVEAHRLGVVLSAPFQMKLAASGREPDLLFLSQVHRDRLKENRVEGPADLVVEIISPESAARDRGDKFYEYEAAGIPEYWLIDPQREQAEFYQLDPQGHYQPARLDEQGTYASKALPGLRLPVAWLWNPPMVIEAIKALSLI